ncbi:MAG: molybdenum cofactor biosynthesis protein MoaE [bacterium]
MSSGRILARIDATPLRAAELEGFVAVPASGGIVVFTGVVRDHHHGRAVLRIEYAAVATLAQAKLAELAAEALRDPEIQRVAAVHRVGLLEVGEASVIVAASAAHRDDAFRAARFLIDRIKETLPVWKREHFADGTAEWAEGFSIPVADRGTGAPRAEVR